MVAGDEAEADLLYIVRRAEVRVRSNLARVLFVEEQLGSGVDLGRMTDTLINFVNVHVLLLHGIVSIRGNQVTSAAGMNRGVDLRNETIIPIVMYLALRQEGMNKKESNLMIQLTIQFRTVRRICWMVKRFLLRLYLPCLKPYHYSSHHHENNRKHKRSNQQPKRDRQTMHRSTNPRNR